jgi:hypothetical protein
MGNNYAKKLLAKIGSASKTGGKDRLGIGNHRLALLSFYETKNQQEGKAGPTRLVAEFEVLESTNPAYTAGMKRSISFFVTRPEYPGYEQARAQELIECVANCLGDKRSVPEVGEDMYDGKICRGVVMECVVEGEVDENGQPKRGARGNQFQSENWRAVPQTLSDVAAAKAELDQKWGAQKSGEQENTDEDEEQPAPLPAKAKSNLLTRK